MNANSFHEPEKISRTHIKQPVKAEKYFIHHHQFLFDYADKLDLLVRQYNAHIVMRAIMVRLISSFEQKKYCKLRDYQGNTLLV